MQSKIDALGLNEETQSNAARHEALKSVLGTQAKSAEQQQQYLYDLGKIRLENEGKVNSATARAGGDKNGLKEYQKGQLQDMAVQAAQRESGFNNLNDTEKQQRVEYYMDMYRNMIPSLPQTAQTVNTPVPRVAYQPPPTR